MAQTAQGFFSSARPAPPGGPAGPGLGGATAGARPRFAGAPSAEAASAAAAAAFGGNHTSTWAVLACASRYWFNYRHVANTLAFYRTVKRLGVPDERIVLMLGDDVACDARNPLAPAVYSGRDSKGSTRRGGQGQGQGQGLLRGVNLYGERIEVDYRGYEATSEAFLRVLTGRHPPGTPRSKMLLTDERSNVLVFLSGHGGDEFLKFLDKTEGSAHDFAAAVAQMRTQGRLNEMLFLVDTCQAATLLTRFHTLGVVGAASSAKGENSYSLGHDRYIGVATIDRWTHAVLSVAEGMGPDSNMTLAALLGAATPRRVGSTPALRDDLLDRPADQVRATDFFGSVFKVEDIGNEPFDFAGIAWP